MALIPALYAKSTKKDLPASYHPPQHSLSHFFSDHKNTSVTRFVSRFPFWYWTFIVLRFFSWHGRHDEAPKCTLNRRGATWNFLMRLGTHDATFYGGLKHATTLNRFFFPRSLNLDPFLKNSTPGTQSLKTCEIISVVKIWCVCFRASFQFARSASVRSSHVAFSFRMPCRFGVTQRFWTNMFVSFWLIYPMFFVGVILSSTIPIKISI